MEFQVEKVTTLEQPKSVPNWIMPQELAFQNGKGEIQKNKENHILVSYN